LTSFVGRQEELAAVAKGLEGSRLVTLTGTGGVGKTRLAVQAAANLIPGFPDGVWLCELAAAVDSESVLQVVASALEYLAAPGLRRQTSALLHDALDEGRLRQLRAEGEAMDSDQAAAYALEAIRRARQPTPQ
jgi:predicted ATPase